MKGTNPLHNPCSNPILSLLFQRRWLLSSHTLLATIAVRMAERVGFEPTVPLPRRMLSKHVDSSTLAPLRRSIEAGILACAPMSGKERLTASIAFLILREAREGTYENPNRSAP